ncbi:Viral cathepsin [Capsicum baccatum]|uniref:Viral cathepsin n=1 Tax=Capsicum baccatum TaxID=33114 RepID=A0A2G2VE50_CAPBA|nr:Viral cathepsin [Capsicum baccatum]
MDFGATRHVCANKELFSMFTLAQGEEMIFMANSATAKLKGIGKVCLKITSGKVLTLNNVLDISNIKYTKRVLESKFGMKDLGVVDVILGIRIHRTPQGLALSQSHYIEKVLDIFKYLEFGIAKTPLDGIYSPLEGEEPRRAKSKIAKGAKGVKCREARCAKVSKVPKVAKGKIAKGAKVAKGVVLYHALLVIGRGIQNSQPFSIIKNWWGPTWGVNGYAPVWHPICWLSMHTQLVLDKALSHQVKIDSQLILDEAYSGN